MQKINHESDFKLPVEPKEIPNLSASPFELVFYTRKSVNKYVASYDGAKYTNCYPTSDGGLVVVFDNHNLGCGTMWCDVHLPLPDKDFKDGIFNYRSTEPTGVLLHKGATDDVRGLKMDVFPFFLQGADGKSAYDLWLDQGNEGTVEEFLASLSFPNDPVLDEELYYDNGSGEVVPVKHPDLATQPNILPYKLAGNYVYEQLISIPNDIKFSTSNGYVKFSIDAPKWEIEKPSVLKATLMSSNVASVNEPQMCMPCIVSNAGDSLSVYVSDVLLAEKGSLKDLWLLLEYSSFDARGGYYYERSNGDIAEEEKYVIEFYLGDGVTPYPAPSGTSLNINHLGSIDISGNSKVVLTKEQARTIYANTDTYIKTSGYDVFSYMAILCGHFGTSKSLGSVADRIYIDETSLRNSGFIYGSFGALWEENTTIKLIL